MLLKIIFHYFLCSYLYNLYGMFHCTTWCNYLYIHLCMNRMCNLMIAWHLHKKALLKVQLSP